MAQSALLVAMFYAGARLLRLDRRGRRNALDIQLVARSISFPDLPRAFDGYRILHLSDTHLDCLPELAAVASRLITGIEVDLLVLTGDIHGRQRVPLADSTGPLAELIGVVRVKDRHLAILGNHDPAAMAEALEGLGFKVLINESTVLSRGGEHIVVTGLDDVHRFFTSEALAALSRAAEGFRIALVHRSGRLRRSCGIRSLSLWPHAWWADMPAQRSADYYPPAALRVWQRRPVERWKYDRLYQQRPQRR